MFALEFPPINAILRWKDLFPTFNKVALIAVAAALIGIIIFLLAGNRDGTKPPKGVRNLAEIIVEFIEDQIVMPTMGRAGLRWTPFLVSLFVFIYLCNITGRHPDHADAGDGAHRHPAEPQPARLGDLHPASACKHQGLGYFGHLALAARRSDRAQAARRASSSSSRRSSSGRSP